MKRLGNAIRGHEGPRDVRDGGAISPHQTPSSQGAIHDKWAKQRSFRDLLSIFISTGFCHGGKPLTRGCKLFLSTVVVLVLVIVAMAHLVSYDTSIAIASLVRNPHCHEEPTNWFPPVEYKVMPHPSDVRFDDTRTVSGLRGDDTVK